MLSCLVVRKSHYFSHNLHYYNTFLPSLTQTAQLVPGLMKARLPKNEMCCDWLAVPVRCGWRTALDCVLDGKLILCQREALLERESSRLQNSAPLTDIICKMK